MLALAFSVLLNVLILGTLVWPAWLESRLRFTCGAAALVLWIAALWETRGELRRLAREREANHETLSANHDPTNDRLLSEAQLDYLRGDWPAAENRLRQAIRRDKEDFESRFWLVSVLRNAGRIRQAERLLRRVERLDAAAAWRHEVADERRRLKNEQQETRQQQDPQTITDSPPDVIPITPQPTEKARSGHRAA